ncbi:MAG TPA: peptidase M20, partial [Treponema sp.]|nr:peptidase M20 [Treponema sp.]
GKACHAGRPHVGKNAVEQASKVIIALKNIQYDVSNSLFEKGLEKPSLSVNLINGGIRNNIIAEDCTFLIDRRLLPG